MKKIKLFSLVLCCLIVLTIFCGCADDYFKTNPKDDTLKIGKDNSLSTFTVELKNSDSDAVYDWEYSNDKKGDFKQINNLKDLFKNLQISSNPKLARLDIYAKDQHDISDDAPNFSKKDNTISCYLFIRSIVKDKNKKEHRSKCAKLTFILKK